jgi:predicted nucleotidyltransferase
MPIRVATGQYRYACQDREGGACATKSATIRDVERQQVGTVRSETAITGLVHRIVQHFSPDKVILFGSHARGESGPESDVDLLVLFAELEDARERARELYRVLGGGALSKDIIVSTTARFERYKNVPNTIYWPAAREGRVLYERPA